MTQNIAHLADVPVNVTADLQALALTVGDILALKPGSLLRTDRAAGDSIDLRAGGQFIGNAELIVIENAIAMRISNLREKK